MRGQNFVQFLLGVRKIRRQPQRFPIVRNRLHWFAFLFQCLGQAIVRLGLIWCQAQFLSELRGSVGGLMIIQVGESEVEASFRIVRLQLNDLQKVHNRFRQFILSGQGDSEVFLCVGKIGLKAHCFKKLSHCPVSL